MKRRSTYISPRRVPLDRLPLPLWRMALKITSKALVRFPDSPFWHAVWRAL